MRVATVHAVRQQYGFRCGYCGISETDAGTTLTVDHFHPRSQGGSDDFANLVYCCHACNEHKNDYWNLAGTARLLHPMRDDFTAHFIELEDGILSPLTETGSFHITRLQLNRPALIRHRQTIREEQQDRQNRAAIVEVLNRLEETLQALKAAINTVRAGGE